MPDLALFFRSDETDTIRINSGTFRPVNRGTKRQISNRDTTYFFLFFVINTLWRISMNIRPNEVEANGWRCGNAFRTRRGIKREQRKSEIPWNTKKPHNYAGICYISTHSAFWVRLAVIYHTPVVTDDIANIFTHLNDQVRLAREWWFLRDSNPRPTD